MMDLDEAIQHCREQVQEQAKKGCYSCAEEHHQLAEWLKELKAYREKLNCTDCIIDGTDACSRGAGRAVDDEICGDFIPSRSEKPNTCGDAISRQAVLNAMYDLCDTGETLKENPWRDNPHIDAIIDAIDDLPSVTPQQRTGAEVLDKIRAEIMDFEEELFHRPNTDYTDYAAVRHCVEIIDKYKAESEDIRNRR